jgi:hypothetical protein
MTTQYLRQVSLIVGKAGGLGYDLSELHIKFSVRSMTSSTLKMATIRVYNLADQTLKAILAIKEFTSVVLQAGYVGMNGDGNLATIFSGQVNKFIHGKENGTDTFLDIVGCDGDFPNNFGLISTSLAQGYTQTDLYNTLLSAWAKVGVQKGICTPMLSNNPYPRGITLAGQLRDFTDDLAKTLNAEWNIENGFLNICGIYDVAQVPVPDINVSTGMLGIPQQTLNGLVVKCLLNPQIQVYGAIHINNADAVQTALVQAFDPSDFNLTLDADGYYKVLMKTHTGDTRGLEWQTEMICGAADETGTAPNSAINAIAEGQQ